jgi:crotonobetainyl-CoA:carnitine CoA-transferase CaiB-like acyl-CoA transferase
MTETPIRDSVARSAPRTSPAFDPLAALDSLLSDVGLSSTATGGSISFTGEDPLVPASHRLGACIGIPVMANAVAAVAFHRQRGGPAQDLDLDLRQAVHGINPGAFWHPALNGLPAPHPLVLDNPFLLTPYRTADGRWIMASGVYPRLAARWCRFLDVPPDGAKVAAAIARWDAVELEEAASAVGLAACVVRSPGEWLAHEHGAMLASEPVIGLQRIGEAPASDFGHARRPFAGVRVLSFTHAVAGPVVGRTLAEHGADVLCGTRPNDYEHEFIYAEANVGSRSAYLDLATAAGRDRADALLADAHVVVNNHRRGALERHGLNPNRLAARYPGVVYVSVTCYGSRGPWADRGGFDMNASAASGLMTTEGTDAEPRLPVTALINDYVTGYLGAVGASAALVKRATEGGSWHVTVNLTRAAMWCGSLGLVDPALAGCDADHSLREPSSYDAASPLGEVHMLAPPVRFSATTPAWPTPLLVPRGSSRAEWGDTENCASQTRRRVERPYDRLLRLLRSRHAARSGSVLRERLLHLRIDQRPS